MRVSELERSEERVSSVEARKEALALLAKDSSLSGHGKLRGRRLPACFPGVGIVRAARSSHRKKFVAVSLTQSTETLLEALALVKTLKSPYPNSSDFTGYEEAFNHAIP
nr:hypothetical protein CFP56_77596 [Quercus suber]